MGRQSVAVKSDKTSSVATSAVPSTSATTSTKSSILKASFAPSRYQLRLFASIIQGFESQQLRIHDTSTGRLRCQHNIKQSATVTCLEWGQFTPSKSQTPSKKRKSIGGEDVVVAYGTTDGEISLFSPASATVISSLVGGHERGIRDFKFSQHQQDDAWSLGGDDKLVQWNLKSSKVVRTITLPEPGINTLSLPSLNEPENSIILCASTTPFALTASPGNDVQVQSFDSMRRPVTVLLRSDHDRDNSGGDELFLSVDHGRHIHVYSIEQKSLIRTLLAGGEVTEANLYHGETGKWSEQLLSVTTKDGAVELFMRPFVLPSKQNGPVESNRKNLTQKATAKVYLVNSDAKKTRVPIFAASLQGAELHVVSVDSGVELTFQKIRWQDEGTGELLFDGIKEVTRTKAASSLNTATMNGAKIMAKAQLDESQTVVVNGGAEGSSQVAIIELDDSDEAEDESEANDDSDDASLADAKSRVVEEEQQQDEDDPDEEMQDVGDVDADADAEEDGKVEATQEPSFGDLLAARNNGTIDIASFAANVAEAPTVNNGLLSIPTGLSLGTVLTQALRTNDRVLLEACLHTKDQAIIASTVQRLDSSLAGTLIGKIAERMASRPGRYGDLQVWVQQLCVAHGGAFSSMPETKAKLKTLFTVLDQRAKTLQPLLLLKGKLDMLDAQLRFRRQLAAERASREQDAGGVVLVEGEDDNWSSDEDIAADGNSKKRKPGRRLPKSLAALEDLVGEDSDEEADSEGEGMPLSNGLNHHHSSDDEDEEDSDEASNDPTTSTNPRHNRLVDDIAEEEEDADEDNEEGDSLSNDDDDDDEEEEDEEEEDSEMDSFIDDGPIEQDQEADDPLLDDADETSDDDDKNDEKTKSSSSLKRPLKKKSRH